MIYIAAARQAYGRLEISDIGFIRIEYSPSDAFTKPKNCTALEKLPVEGKVSHPVEEWVVRRDSRSRFLKKPDCRSDSSDLLNYGDGHVHERDSGEVGM